jgi:phospholipase D1/2
VHKGEQGGRQRRRIWIGVAILIVLFAAAAAWKWTPLADLINVNRAARWAASLRESPIRHLYLIGAYVIGSVLLIPITLLILITAVVFGAALGAVYSLIGCLAGALVTYAIGYFLGQDFVRKVAGSKWKGIERKIGQTGIIAVATLRLLPVAPFSVVNIVSGAFKVPLRDYILGSILGLVPGILITNLFAHQFQSAIRNPGIGTFLLLAGLIVVSVLGTIWLKRRFETAT